MDCMRPSECQHPLKTYHERVSFDNGDLFEELRKLAC